MNALGLQIGTWREVARRLHLEEIGVPHDPDTKYSGTTLGAFRRGRNMSWVPGAEIDVWTPCAAQEPLTGTPWPHCYFVQTIGGQDGGSVHCPSCRAEIALRRARGRSAPVAPPAPAQGSLF